MWPLQAQAYVTNPSEGNCPSHLARHLPSLFGDMAAPGASREWLGSGEQWWSGHRSQDSPGTPARLNALCTLSPVSFLSHNTSQLHTVCSLADVG